LARTQAQRPERVLARVRVQRLEQVRPLALALAQVRQWEPGP
jgi:hypothetical protein